MTDDELAESTLPFWVANDEPEPPTVFAWLHLDRADQDGSVAGGALLLRATPTIGGWTRDAARDVFLALASVLPDGLAQRTREAELTRVVFADAADVRAGRVGDLPIGPPPLPAPGAEQIAALTEVISEAMFRGWITMEPMDDSAPARLRAVLPSGMGLTAEGQKFVAERLGLDRPAGNR